VTIDANRLKKGKQKHEKKREFLSTLKSRVFAKENNVSVYYILLFIASACQRILNLPLAMDKTGKISACPCLKQNRRRRGENPASKLQ